MIFSNRRWFSMKLLGTLYLCLLCTGVVTAQVASDDHAPPDILILNHKISFGRERYLPHNWENSSESYPGRSDPLPGVVSMPSTEGPARRPRVRFLRIYSVEIKNIGTKKILGVVWEYVFTATANQREFVRLQFRTPAKVDANKRLTLVGKTLLEPLPLPKVASVEELRREDENPYREHVEIKCILYSDGSWWRDLRVLESDCESLIKDKNRKEIVTDGQTLEEKLAVKVDTFDSEAKSVLLQLIEVAQRFSIPMGIEWSDDSEDQGPFKVHVRDTTAGSLLSQILAQQSGYEFRLEDGVVHIFATRLVDHPYNFLNIRLREFSLEKASMEAATFHLWGAIFLQLHPQGGYGGGWDGVSRYKDFNAPKITLACKDLTLRQALSKIAVVQGNALWVVRIRERQMMESEPFYVQIAGPEAGEPSNSFAWQFIALDVNRVQ
jgi:hypothetical protein